VIDPTTGSEIPISRPSKIGIAVHRYWPVIGVLSILFAAIGYFGSSLTAKTYTASGEVFVTEPANAANVDTDITTVAHLIESQSVVRPVAASLGQSPVKLSSALTVTPEAGAEVITIDAQAPSPARAVNLVRLLYQSFLGVDGSLPASQRHSTYLSAPASPRAPSAPKPTRDAAIGLILGLLLAVGGAWLREIQQPTAADRTLVADRLGAPMLADLGRRRPRRSAAKSRAKALTALSLDLDELAPQGTSVLCLAAVRDGDLMPDISSGLAAAFASGGWRVILVQGDPGRSSSSSAQSGPRGLSDLIGSPVEPAGLLVETGDRGVKLLPHGQRGLDRAQPHLGAELRRIYGQLAAVADLVLVSVPSVGQDSEARLIAASAHGTILFVRGATPIEMVEYARERLRLFRAVILGFVIDEGHGASDRIWSRPNQLKVLFWWTRSRGLPAFVRPRRSRRPGASPGAQVRNARVVGGKTRS
jgi:capsular polysaccharide biosynthesis protein